MHLFVRSVVFWMLIALITVIAIVWFFSTVLTPFICSLILAYLLTPLVSRFEIFGLSRAVGGIIILLLAIGVIIGFSLLVFPIFLIQIQSLITSLPEIYDYLQLIFKTLLHPLLGENFSINSEFFRMNEIFTNHGLKFVSDLVSSFFAFFDFLILLFTVPLITFYLLIDWNRMMENMTKYLPNNFSLEIRDIFLQIDHVLSGFVRGQILICITLGTFYSLALSVCGLSYGLLIGVFSGLISFIPFLGSALGATIAIFVAIYQFWDNPSLIFLVTFIFIIGQLLESNLLTPKLIGDAVRLHPISIMLSVSIGGAIAGINGILVAVPVAGTLGVLLRVLFQQYLESSFYQGTK